MWSTKHQKCLGCGTIEVKHKGNGLCRRCWHNEWVRNHQEQRREHKQREYRKNRKRYQEGQKRYADEHKAELKSYWQQWHRDRNFGGNYEKVLDRDGGKCLLCGSKKSIIVHHVDENRQNNEMDNLRTLCRKCHPKIHYSKDRVKIQSELCRNVQSQAEMF